MTRVFAGSLVGYYGGGDVRGGLERWLADVNASLDAHLPAPLCLAWDTGTVVDRDVPDAALEAVRLLACYAQHAELPWPDELPEDRATDPAWQRASAGDFAATRFPQVLIPEVWLPGDFAFTARQAMPDGEEWVVGSLAGLCAQLAELDRQTLQVGMSSARGAGPAPAGREFLELAEYGLAAWVAAATRARGAGVALIVRG